MIIGRVVAYAIGKLLTRDIKRLIAVERIVTILELNNESIFWENGTTKHMSMRTISSRSLSREDPAMSEIKRTSCLLATSELGPSIICIISAFKKVNMISKFPEEIND